MHDYIWHVRTAAKPHNCERTNCHIVPGQKYVEEKIPPWTHTIDDPDDLRGHPLGHWEVRRWCLAHDLEKMF